MKNKILYMFLGFIFGSMITYTTMHKKPPNLKCNNVKTAYIIHLYNDTINDSILYSYIKEIGIEHPKVVLAQCKLESGNYTSRLYKQNKNLIGMKLPHNRPTLAHYAKDIKGRKSNGYAHYKTWKECILDYALYQCRYCKNILTDEEYLDYLQRNYSESNNYKKILKEIIDYDNKTQ